MLLAVPIVGYFYGGMSNIDWMTDAIRFYFLPLIAFSGLWLWKGNLVKKRLIKKNIRLSREKIIKN